MVDITFRPIGRQDLQFIHEVRHHPETLPYLHDDRTFTVEETIAWFEREQPQWLLIQHGGQPVGYVRTTHRDERNSSIKVGADIHPSCRRRGLATAAYLQLLERLRHEGWHRIWLEVLAHNHAAIELYKKLGFRLEGCKRDAVSRNGRWHDSILMSLVEQQAIGRNVKVVVVYLGRRRACPHNAKEAYPMLRFLLDRESSLDPGCPMDTLLVYNRVRSADQDGDQLSWQSACETLLHEADGSSSRRGCIRLIERQNVGLSFGGYNHAFSTCGSEYDYWHFTEDDQIMVKGGCFSRAIEQMQSDSRIGFVAVVGVCNSSRHPPHAHGGVGISSREILRSVMSINPSEAQPQGHLPHHVSRGYHRQVSLGEIRFTNAIHKLGYTLVDLDMQEVCVSWGRTRRRTPRMVPWSETWATPYSSAPT